MCLVNGRLSDQKHLRIRIIRPLQDPIIKMDLSSDPDPGKKYIDPAKYPILKMDLDPVKILSRSSLHTC